jgi:phage tail P2-like protein
VNALVPANHRMFEHALADVLSPIGAIDPRAIETVWDAWRCPAALLPFAAYALSVDFWDDAWDEIRKRRAIAESPAHHRRKGTRAAVEQAATYTQREVRIVEWHEFTPPARRGTFEIYLYLRDGEGFGEVAAETALLKRLITSAKPKSRSFALLVVADLSLGVGVGAALLCCGGVRLDVPADPIEVSLSPVVFLTIGAVAPLEV